MSRQNPIREINFLGVLALVSIGAATAIGLDYVSGFGIGFGVALTCCAFVAVVRVAVIASGSTRELVESMKRLPLARSLRRGKKT